MNSKNEEKTNKKPSRKYPNFMKIKTVNATRDWICNI